MTLLSVVQDVCAVVGVNYPTTVFSGISGNRTMIEMLSLANEMSQRIAYDTREWTRLKKVHTIVGDGVTTAWELPADYKRMLLSTNVWRSTSTSAPMMFVPNTDEWLNRRADYNGSNATWGEWTMYGGQIHIETPLSALEPAVPAVPEDPGPPYVPPVAAIPEIPAETAYFTYLHRNCIRLAGGGFGDRFMSDGDSFVLDERILKLGMIWQWKGQKGSSYAEDMATYEEAIAYEKGADGPAPILIGRLPLSANAAFAYPFSVPS